MVRQSICFITVENYFDKEKARVETMTKRKTPNHHTPRLLNVQRWPPITKNINHAKGSIDVFHFSAREPVTSFNEFGVADVVTTLMLGALIIDRQMGMRVQSNPSICSTRVCVCVCMFLKACAELCNTWNSHFTHIFHMKCPLPCNWTAGRSKTLNQIVSTPE